MTLNKDSADFSNLAEYFLLSECARQNRKCALCVDGRSSTHERDKKDDDDGSILSPDDD